MTLLSIASRIGEERVWGLSRSSSLNSPHYPDLDLATQVKKKGGSTALSIGLQKVSFVTELLMHYPLMGNERKMRPRVYSQIVGSYWRISTILISDWLKTIFIPDVQNTSAVR